MEPNQDNKKPKFSKLKIVSITAIISIITVSSIFAIDNYVKENQAETSEITTTKNKLEVEDSLVEHTTSTAVEETQNEEPSFDSFITDAEYHSVAQGGWIPHWSINEGIASLNANQESEFEYISPVWYEIQGDGSIVNIASASKISSVTSYAKLHNIKVIPTIAQGDADSLSLVLNDNYATHLNSIVNEVLTNDYDGIDLDYEMIYLTDKNLYQKLLLDLGNSLHARNKILSVTVLSKWGANISYSALPETRAVQDWEYIASVADQVRIMAYDYHVPSSESGPISPYDWNEMILDYAITVIPQDKIWLGVHLYGYEWRSDGTASALTYDTTSEFIDTLSAGEYEFLEGAQEGYATYECYDSLTCHFYFQTPEGVIARKKLAFQYDIAGVYYWKLGGDDGLFNN